MSSAQPQTTAAWHESFPSVVSAAVYLPRATMLRWFEEKVAGRDYILVDLRRNDHEGGTIKGSLNLPAQSFYYSIPTLYTLASNADVSAVIFYCGSSAGRGSRAAAWFQDYLNEKGVEKIKSYALEGGIKGWVKEGGKCLELMDGYDASVWQKN
ncbi:hypothetical protein RUND412_003614 [Rhizina undulata]